MRFQKVIEQRRNETQLYDSVDEAQQEQPHAVEQPDDQ